MAVELKPIPVAESLRRPHPVVRALRDHPDWFPIKGPVRVPALRILDAIAKAASARGYPVTAPKPEPGSRQRRGHLVVTIGRHPGSGPTCVLDVAGDVMGIPAAAPSSSGLSSGSST